MIKFRIRNYDKISYTSHESHYNLNKYQYLYNGIGLFNFKIFT